MYVVWCTLVARLVTKGSAQAARATQRRVRVGVSFSVRVGVTVRSGVRVRVRVSSGAPMVRKPSGSTERAISNASLLTRSTLAGLTARMRHVGCRMYVCTSARMRRSMSLGWSPTGFLASPGRSTSVIVLRTRKVT